MKKMLAVAVLAVLALASFSVLFLPNVMAQTGQAQVTSYSWYVAPSTTITAAYANDLVAVGEVQNTGSVTIGTMWVLGQALDSNGTVLATSQAQVMALNLAPAQRAPFYLDFTPEGSVTQDQSWVPNVANVSVSIGSVTAPSGAGSQYDGLVTSNLNDVISGGVYTVTGTITNYGDRSVGDVAAVVTFYNASTVVAVNFQDLGKALTPGQSTTFSVAPWDNTADVSGQIANYTILLQSILTPTVTPAPTAEPTVPPTSPPSASPSPTQTTGTAQPLNLVYAVVIVVAVIVIIGIAIVIIRGKGSRSAKVTATPPPP